MILLPEAESVCYLIKWKQLEGVVTAAHIHAAAKGLTGPHHIDLFNDLSLSDAKDRTSSCVKVQHGGHGGHVSAQDKICSISKDFVEQLAALVSQSSLDQVLGWNLVDDDEIDGDVAIIASATQPE